MIVLMMCHIHIEVVHQIVLLLMIEDVYNYYLRAMKKITIQHMNLSENIFKDFLSIKIITKYIHILP